MKTRRAPLISEARSARMELSAQFGHDLRKLCAFLRKEEAKHPKHPVKAPRAPRSRQQTAAA